MSIMKCHVECHVECHVLYPGRMQRCGARIAPIQPGLRRLTLGTLTVTPAELSALLKGSHTAVVHGAVIGSSPILNDPAIMGYSWPHTEIVRLERQGSCLCASGLIPSHSASPLSGSSTLQRELEGKASSGEHRKQCAAATHASPSTEFPAPRRPRVCHCGSILPTSCHHSRIDSPVFTAWQCRISL